MMRMRGKLADLDALQWIFTRLRVKTWKERLKLLLVSPVLLVALAVSAVGFLVYVAFLIAVVIGVIVLVIPATIAMIVGALLVTLAFSIFS